MRLARSATVAAVTGTLVAGTALAASAITGGTVDSANKYSNVALIGFYADGGRYRCSASLISPTLLLTAAHCTDGVDGQVAVTFDWEVADAPPSPLPEATKPEDGYTQAQLEAAGYLSGKAYTHPKYSNFTDVRNWNDVGVVVLDKPVNDDIKPVELAPVGYLDQFAPKALNKTLFTIVGYGTEVRQGEGPTGNAPAPMDYPMVRRYTDAPGQKLTPQILQVNGNENDPRGGGGSCFGDSGGPTFHKGVQVTVTSYGYTNNCRYLDGLQRVDIPVVQTWLAEFGFTPAG